MALDFGYNDLYPGTGLYNTRATTVAEDEDQQALIEGDDMTDLPAATSKSIWGAVLLVICLITFMGMVSR